MKSILLKCGILGSIISGLGGMFVFGKTGGTLATIAGLFGGPILFNAWMAFRRKLNPVICLECGSKESEIYYKELGSREFSKPVHRSNLMEYNNTCFLGKDQALLTHVDEITVVRTTYEEINKCKSCGHIHSKRKFSVETNIYLNETKKIAC